MARIELHEVECLLERARRVLSAEDYARRAGLIETLIELTRLVHRQGTTIARLRRWLGHSSTEKTAAVLLVAHAAAGSEGNTSSEVEGRDAGTGREVQGSGDAAAHRSKPKGHGRRSVTAYQARHIAVPHATLHVGDRCPRCGRGKLHRLTEPARHLRVFGQAPLIAICWDCERTRCGACGEVFTAPPPAEACGPKYAESAASMMALMRYGTGLPLHRLGRLQESLGIPLPASTQWEVVLERVAALTPIYDELVRRAAAGSVLHNDDTYMRILEFIGRRRAKLLASGELPDPDRTGLFTTALVSITTAGPIALFLTGRQHAGENLTAVLEQRAPSLGPPIQMCDALERNRPRGHEIIEANCLCHARRHIVEQAENFPAECRYVLEQLGIVFAHEACCKKNGWSGEERLRFHQEQSAPVMAGLEAWMRAALDERRVEPNSGLGQAFDYLRSRWDQLTRFLRVRDAPLENNIAERALKMAIRHRRNSLFYRSRQGAHVGDLYMTLIYTAALHGENPFEYLTALLAHERRVAERPADWLPWTYRTALERLEARASPAA
jgi:transposase